VLNYAIKLCQNISQCHEQTSIAKIILLFQYDNEHNQTL